MRSVLAVACLVLLPQASHAAGRLAEVHIIDRDSGAQLPAYYHRGEYWVAGKPGARYAIEIRNTLHERVLAVTSVDGINVLTGDTARWDQTGYVFDGEQAYEINGWRKSQAEVADFEFAAAPNSYAARTGRSANIGVIGVAVFRERVSEYVAPPPPVAAAPLAPPARESSAESNTLGGADLNSSAQGLASSAAAAVAVPAPPAKLGTGHGAREQSYVEFTDFIRADTRPNEIVRIRYDSRENLLAMGIIPHPANIPVAPNPFPDSPLAHFVPDPPSCNREPLRQCLHD
jgi:hypothetical protein